MLKMRNAKLLLFTSFFLMAHVYLRTYKHKGRHAYTIYTYLHHTKGTHAHAHAHTTIKYMDIRLQNRFYWFYIYQKRNSEIEMESCTITSILGFHLLFVLASTNGCGWHRDKAHCFCVRHSANQLYFITKKKWNIVYMWLNVVRPSRWRESVSGWAWWVAVLRFGFGFGLVCMDVD